MRTAMMNGRAAAVAVGVALFLASSAAGTDVTGYITQRHDRLAWSKLTIGMTRRTAERVLGRKIDVDYSPESAVACGLFDSHFTMHGRRVGLQWSSAAPDAQLESIVIPFTASERRASGSRMRAALVRRMPQLQCRAIDGSGDAICILPSDDPTDVLIKPHIDRYLYMGFTRCGD